MGHGAESQHLRCLTSVEAEITKRSLQRMKQCDAGSSGDNSHEQKDTASFISQSLKMWFRENVPL